MHIDKCPKCGDPGFLVKKYRRCGKPNCKCATGSLHGPYWTVQHHPSRFKPIKDCHISQKLLTGDLEERIKELLAKEQAGLI
jgi:hypothetical protein